MRRGWPSGALSFLCCFSHLSSAPSTSLRSDLPNRCIFLSVLFKRVNNSSLLVTVHREHKVKRGNQQDATNSMFIIKLSISTCFGHHYAHHQENKIVSYCMRRARRNSTRPQPTTTYTPRQNTACSRTRSYSPDDGHNDVRNMLR